MWQSKYTYPVKTDTSTHGHTYIRLSIPTRYMSNPFIANTPTSSPSKGKKIISTPGSVITTNKSTSTISTDNGSFPSISTSTSTSNHASPKKRIHKRPTSQSFGYSSNSLLSSPTRRPRTASNSMVYSDRFIPSRTDINLNSMASIASTASLAPSSSSHVECDDQVIFQREKHAHETFDTLLKNEIFGDILTKDDATENGIEKIKYTTSRAMTNDGKYLVQEPATPSPERNDSFFDSRSSSVIDLNGILNQGDRGNSRFRDQNTDTNSRDGDDSPRGRRSSVTSDGLNSAPVTPRRLFSADERYKPSSNSGRSASLFTYRERSATKRPSSASSFIHSSQFNTSISPVRPDSKQLLLSPSKYRRKIARVPYRVLDAPSLADDFYFDLIDWSSTDVVAVALDKAIFLSNNTTGEVTHLGDSDDEFTSLSWVGAGSHLAVGHKSGLIGIYDVTKKKCIRRLRGHTDRVACLSWNHHILSSGSRDRKIFHTDVRTPEYYFQTIEAHQQEVCGLKWNIDENKLASGGNDNIVNVYDGTSRTPYLTLTEHKAAVKAMAWSPHRRGILATGGGTADRRLKIWNVNNQTKLNDVDTNSQICNMLWSKNTDEIVTSHGYSKFNLTVWDFPTLDPIAILKGHSFRVLHLSLSADGTTVVSGAGDETLRYWKLFDKPKSKPKVESYVSGTSNLIR